MKNLSLLSGVLAAAAALNHNLLAIAATGADTETFTIDGTVFELDTHDIETITAGRVRVPLYGGATVKAFGTLTLAGNAVAAETVTINGTVYTWRAAPTTVAGEVKVGATASDSLDNLIAAVNGAAGSGTLYGSLTVAHTTVTAAAGAGDTAVFTAKAGGTLGNAYTSTEAMTQGSFGAGTFASGVNPSAANVIAAVVTAINGSTLAPRIYATAVTGGVLITDRSGRGPIACSETMAGAGNAWLAANSFGAVNPGVNPDVPIFVRRAATAAEATAQVMYFPLPTTPTAALVEVITAAGVRKAWDGAVTIVGTIVVLSSSGATDIADTDLVTVLATV